MERQCGDRRSRRPCAALQPPLLLNLQTKFNVGAADCCPDSLIGQEGGGGGAHEEKSCSQFAPNKSHLAKLPSQATPQTYPVFLVSTSALSSVTSSVVVTSLATVVTLSPQVRPRRQDSQDLRFGPMGAQHVTEVRPMRDEKARAPVAWSVSHF